MVCSPRQVRTGSMPQTRGMTRATEGEPTMSWTDFYRRQEILEAVVRLAGRNPASPLALAEVPGAEEHFGTEADGRPGRKSASAPRKTSSWRCSTSGRGR